VVTGQAPSPKTSPRHYSFGSTSAIVTSVGLIVGFHAADVPRSAVVSGLLIIALADNISDSLSIHIYQESEGLEARAAFRATLINFVARLVVSLTFVGIVLAAAPALTPMLSIGWGIVLLGAVTFGVARARRKSPWREMVKHILVALIVIGVSRLVGGWIAVHVH
jgi:VIT1/CCC1 family predicted Fe2+/Mn2+ transporter